MSDAVPQFKTAEYSGNAATCKACGQAISGAYYQVNGAKTCSKCAQRIKEQLPKDSHSAFARGVLFGVGGAILGLGIYVGFALATGLIAGLISLAVGYLVGKAILLGSGGIGGRRYQVAAVLLTYAAVSLAAVPIALSQHMKHRSAQAQSQVSESSSDSPKPSVAKAVGTLALIGLVSPFLGLSNPMQGVIGLIILFVGIRIAWRMTAARQVSILGPINDPTPAATG
ncbi:MAG: hypothetical protein ACLPWG_10775 [Steroidobacteraceae bacterium]